MSLSPVAANPRMTKQQRPLLVGPVSVGLPIKIKVPAPSLPSAMSSQVSEVKHLGRPYVCAWHEVHTASARGKPSSPQPDNSTCTTPRRLAGVQLLEKKRVTERRRSESSMSNMWSTGREFDTLGLNTERNTQMIKPSWARVEGEEEEGRKRAALRNALGCETGRCRWP